MGHENRPGNCVYDPANQAYIIAGVGTNLGRQQDVFHFVWKRIKGDFLVTMRVPFDGSRKNPDRKLGWMARASLEVNAGYISSIVREDGIAALQFRQISGGQIKEVRANLIGADVIQLERYGNQYIMSLARYDEPFHKVQVEEIVLGEDVYVGIIACSQE